MWRGARHAPRDSDGLTESVDIKVFDRGPYVAFANCGLPYYVGDVIADEGALLIASPEMFRERFNVEVHTNTDVISIDRAERTIAVLDLRTGNRRAEPYDALVLSPGAAPIRPPLSGVDLPGVFAVRNIPDSRRIRSWIADRHASTAVVVGGGFIGLEMVEKRMHFGADLRLPRSTGPTMVRFTEPVSPTRRLGIVHSLRSGDADGRQNH